MKLIVLQGVPFVAIVVIVMKTMFTVVIMEMISSGDGGTGAVAINGGCVAGDNGDDYSEDIDDYYNGDYNDAVDKDYKLVLEKCVL